MKKIAVFVFLFSAKLLAMPIHEYACADKSGQWQVQAKIATNKGAKVGSLRASFQGWQVISINLESEVILHVGSEHVSNTGIVFRHDVFDGHTLIVPGHENVELSCQIEFTDKPPATCRMKYCGHDGAVWYKIEVGPGYQCVQPNIMCKT